MIATVKAATFIKALPSGRTCPCLMICEDDEGAQHEIVVKLPAIDTGVTGLTCELLASLLADDLDIIVPKPFLVDIDQDFHKAIPDPVLAERFKSNPGLSFGSLFLGAGYATWPQGRSVPSSLFPVVADIFAFDILIQNPDRRVDKPNLLRKGDDLVVFDHEMAFSFLYAIDPRKSPWDNAGIEFAAKHIFYPELKGKCFSWDRLQGALETIDNRRLMAYEKMIPALWRRKGADNKTVKILAYMREFPNQSKVLFQKLSEVLR